MSVRELATEQTDFQSWAHSTDETLEQLDASDDGLSETEALNRRKRFGANLLETSKPTSIWSVLLRQFKSIVVLLLVAAGVVALLFGDYIEAAAIGLVLVINAAIGFFMELRGVRSMEALKKQADTQSTVIRDGTAKTVPARQLVPGDTLSFQAGDVVGADIRLIETNELDINESALTGESVPVTKSTDVVDADTPLADRTNMAYRGTAVTRGSGLGVVVATGMSTELGRISDLVSSSEKKETPLERRLDKLGERLVWISLALAALIASSGLARAESISTIIETALALAVATIPEGLPIVATIALARGMWRMARRNALVRNLAAVETLGSASVILTDKTGTLTENRMETEAYWLDDERLDLGKTPGEKQRTKMQRALEIGALCNNTDIDESGQLSPGGEPMETALAQIASEFGLDIQALRESHPRIREEAFATETKMMGTFHETSTDSIRVAVKGAPEAVIDACDTIAVGDKKEPLDDEASEAWLNRNQQLADNGLRVLALAEKEASDSQTEPYEGLTLVGLVAFIDPPRWDVKAAIERAQQAGIQIVMVTGDQPGTASYVARKVSIAGEESDVVKGRQLPDLDELDVEDYKDLSAQNVFARVTPEQKHSLIEFYQNQGDVVAMTGDGVNDAPALSIADIGIAMGKRGTEVAKEAADMVLQDDAFQTIVTAIQQGRIIVQNIRNFVVFLLSCNVSEILVIGLASLLWTDAPLPLTALQILFLNLVTDVFPALALGLGEGTDSIMTRPPRRRNEPILTRRHWTEIAIYGALLTISVLGTYWYALESPGIGPDSAVTVSFLTLAFAQLWHVFNIRAPESPRFKNEITNNPYVWGALVLCAVILVAVLYIPTTASVLSVAPPSFEGWLCILVGSFMPAVVGLFRPRRKVG
jgi:Ca2+-transporting ATPase